MLVRCEVCGKPLYVPSAEGVQTVECGYCYASQRVPAYCEPLRPGELDWHVRLRRHAMAMRPGEPALRLLNGMKVEGLVTQRQDLCASEAERGRREVAALGARVAAASTVEELVALREGLAGIPSCTEADELRTHLTKRTAELRAKRIQTARQVHMVVAAVAVLALVVWTLL